MTPGRARAHQRPAQGRTDRTGIHVSDNAQLARTGTAGALVIGTTVVTGWWLLAGAAAVVVVGALVLRFGFRRGKNAGQQ